MTKKLCPYARTILRLGFGAAAICLLLSALVQLFAPYCASPHNALLLHRSFREACFALIASGVCACVLSDIMVKHGIHR